MESKVQSETAYTLLSTYDGPVLTESTGAALQGDASWYPGNRRVPITETEGAAGSSSSDRVLIKTGGNALQAIPRSLLIMNENSNESLMTVSVPSGCGPGSTLLVLTPDGTGRMVAATVPQGLVPGHTFLVKIPPLEQFPPAQPPSSFLVTGIPIATAHACHPDAINEDNDLQLAVVEATNLNDVEMMETGKNHENTNH